MKVLYILLLILFVSCTFDVPTTKLPYTCWICEVDIYSLTQPRIFYTETLCNRSEEEIAEYESINNYHRSNDEFKVTFCWKNSK